MCRVEAVIRRKSFARLVSRLRELFPDSAHVVDVALERNAPDDAIWKDALINRFRIVTADSDFLAIANFGGAPPKVVQLQNCNCRTPQVESILRRNAILIVEGEQSSRNTLILRSAG